MCGTTTSRLSPDWNGLGFSTLVFKAVDEYNIARPRCYHNMGMQASHLSGVCVCTGIREIWKAHF